MNVKIPPLIENEKGKDKINKNKTIQIKSRCLSTDGAILILTFIITNEGGEEITPVRSSCGSLRIMLKKCLGMRRVEITLH